MRAGLLLLWCFSSFWLFAQPENDDCMQAFLIEDTSNWCSEAGQFTTEEANPTTGPSGSCTTGQQEEVWFSFVATAINISIIARADASSPSPLAGPEIVLYSGNCSNLQEVACQSTNASALINELIYEGLSLGQTYYIQIEGGQLGPGAFLLCLSAYNTPANPTSDCPDATVLCSKESFIVPKVFGGGDDPSEADGAPCLQGFSNIESSSTWYVWTAGNDGSLTFSLDPLNPGDDIDFVVYEFPNGPGDCSNKTALRCMASSCDGPTGLNETSIDFNEPPNCGLPTQDNFLAALNMVEGTTYGVMINNFSTTGIGFQMSFGGTGTFAGPEGTITSVPNETACQGETVIFSDATAFPNGGIVAWEWDFGADADPATSFEQGPHTVTYNTSGTKYISLRLTTSEGCIITEIIEIDIICCDGQFDVMADLTSASCAGASDGSIAVSVTNPTGPPYSFLWSTGDNGPSIAGLPAGTYELTITDEAACDTVIALEITSPPPLEQDTLLLRPSCDGGTDGSITLLTNGGTPPYSYSWEGAPFIGSNTLEGLPNGIYNVVVQDALGCEQELEILLQELELELSPDVEAIVPPSCPGDSDAQITVSIANGLPPYQYDFNDGNGFVSENVLSQLTEGTYAVEVLDANLCEGSFTFVIEDPPPLAVQWQETSISCFGEADGSITALLTGGTGSYSYSWNMGEDGPTISNLPEGNYQLTITDDKGCQLDTAYFLQEPALLELAVDSFNNLVCFGDTNGWVQLSATGGTTPYQYSTNGQAPQAEPLFENLGAGVYEFLIEDMNACQASSSVTITEPDSLWVSILPVETIELGYTAHIQTQASQPGLSYFWQSADSLSCLDCPAPTILPLSSNWHTLYVQDENGCSAADSIFIEITLNRPAYVPNGFSPNGDGRNDLFQLYSGPGLRIVRSLAIYNRWGGMVYRAENLSDEIAVLSWDGNFKNKPAATGVYTYVIEVEFIDGYRQTLSGDINLIR